MNIQDVKIGDEVCVREPSAFDRSKNFVPWTPLTLNPSNRLIVKGINVADETLDVQTPDHGFTRHPEMPVDLVEPFVDPERREACVQAYKLVYGEGPVTA